MSDFDFFTGWNKVLRWIMFFPMLIVAYFISLYIGRFALFYGYGWVGLDETSAIGYIIFHFYSSFGCVAIALFVSISCAPKFRTIIASVYLGVILIMIGINITFLITYEQVIPIWRTVYDIILTLVASILALLASIEQKKEESVEEYNPYEQFTSN